MRDLLQRQEYIVNLTNHLIQKNKYEDVFFQMNHPHYTATTKKEFIEYVKRNLELGGDVSKMSPTKLGEILCTFEIGDVSVSKKTLFENLHFTGDCEELLRELVSFCLANVIYDRIYPGSYSNLPKWDHRRREFFAG